MIDAVHSRRLRWDAYRTPPLKILSRGSVWTIYFCLLFFPPRPLLSVGGGFTDQLFTGTGTGTGYCSERSDTFGEATAFLSVHCSSRSPWLANSPTFGSLPNGNILKPKWNARALPALLYRHPTGAPVFILNKVGSKMFFFLLIPLKRIGLYGALPDVRSRGGLVY
ncbi:hypothetical protein J6590_080509 [Homalodisca vitripennis]|nr:hypothetical protein J6590_080509 [Homalodisca vitripennis]